MRIKIKKEVNALVDKVQIVLSEKQNKAWNYLTDSTTNEILFGGGAGRRKIFSRVLVAFSNVPKIPGDKVVDGESRVKKLERIHAENISGISSGPAVAKLS